MHARKRMKLALYNDSEATTAGGDVLSTRDSKEYLYNGELVQSMRESKMVVDSSGNAGKRRLRRLKLALRQR